jgi:cytochrome b-561
MGRLDRLSGAADDTADRATEAARGAYGWLDARLGLQEEQSFLGKAFPAEDSFLLGEVALFCFVLLVLTGIFLGMFFEPSTTKAEYDGSVSEYQGEELPESYVSVLNITYDVPFGMFIRRLHHWAAHLFVASIGLHMLRVFFTGAYRNPREPNWVVGTALAALAMGAAYTGYALPFDEFASTATGIGYNLASSVPLVGGLVAKVVFGGEFPSSATIPRLYFLHVFVIPLAIAVGLAVHMGILVKQKHTEASREDDLRGPDESHPAQGAASDGGRAHVDREDDTVVAGLPAFPNQAAVSAVVFFLTLATLSLLAGFLPVHNVAEYGPNDPAGTPSLIMPDWFLMWVYGFLKLLPTWLSFTVFGVHVSTEFLGGVVLPGLVFLGVFAWPFLDYREDPTHFTANPLARPFQTGFGVAAITFIMIASIAGMNNILAEQVLGTSTGAVNNWLTVLLLGFPPLAGALVYLVLSRADVDPHLEDAGETPAANGDGATGIDSSGGDASESDDAGAGDAATQGDDETVDAAGGDAATGDATADASRDDERSDAGGDGA